MKVGIYANLYNKDGKLHPAYAFLEGQVTWIPLEAGTVFKDQHPASLLEIEVGSDDGRTIRQGWGRLR